MPVFNATYGSTVETIRIGTEVEFIVRDAAGHTTATVRLNEDAARELLFTLQRNGV